MTRALAIVLLLVALIWGPSASSQSSMMGIFKANTGGGAATVVTPTCDGTISFAAGCAQPMFGGL